jgi:signal peptide peptidase SppA
MQHRFLADLIRYPWAIVESYLPTISGVLSRIASGEPLSADDRERVEQGRAEWEARRQQGAALAGGAIAVVPVYGVLTQRGGIDETSQPLTSMQGLAATITSAASDPAIGGIVLDVDSPGGSVYGLTELGDAIFAAREAKPIVAVANSMAASAAYWTASQCSALYAAPGAEVGSIGVYTAHYDVSGLMKARGVGVEVISAGKYKTEQNPYGPLSDEARAHVQAGVDAYYESFVKAVARGRGASLKAVREDMGEGRMLMAEQAKAANMIDGVATLSQVVSKLAAKVKRSASARAAMMRDLDIALLD